MKLTKELNENKAYDGTERHMKCCGTTPKGLNTIETDSAPTTYQIYCMECNTTTAPYETAQEASYAWNNKILM